MNEPLNPIHQPAGGGLTVRGKSRHTSTMGNNDTASEQESVVLSGGEKERGITILKNLPEIDEAKKQVDEEIAAKQAEETEKVKAEEEQLRAALDSETEKANKEALLKSELEKSIKTLPPDQQQRMREQFDSIPDSTKREGFISVLRQTFGEKSQETDKDGVAPVEEHKVFTVTKVVDDESARDFATGELTNQYKAAVAQDIALRVEREGISDEQAIKLRAGAQEDLQEAISRVIAKGKETGDYQEVRREMRKMLGDIQEHTAYLRTLKEAEENTPVEEAIEVEPVVAAPPTETPAIIEPTTEERAERLADAKAVFQAGEAVLNPDLNVPVEEITLRRKVKPVFEPEVVKRNAALGDDERIEEIAKTLGVEVGQLESTRTQLLNLHRIGEGEVGKDGTEAHVGNYTRPQLRVKYEGLKNLGYNSEQINNLMRSGLIGRDWGDADDEYDLDDETREHNEGYIKMVYGDEFTDRDPHDIAEAVDEFFRSGSKKRSEILNPDKDIKEVAERMMNDPAATRSIEEAAAMQAPQEQDLLADLDVPTAHLRELLSDVENLSCTSIGDELLTIRMRWVKQMDYVSEEMETAISQSLATVANLDKALGVRSQELRDLAEQRLSIQNSYDSIPNANQQLAQIDAKIKEIKAQTAASVKSYLRSIDELSSAIDADLEALSSSGDRSTDSEGGRGEVVGSSKKSSRARKSRRSGGGGVSAKVRVAAKVEEEMVN